MIIVPSAPITQPSIANIALISANYNFNDGSIFITVGEIDENNNPLGTNSINLTPDQVTAFFATPIPQDANLQQVFIAAFLGAIQTVYNLPAATVSQD